jgi:hypothetical protein
MKVRSLFCVALVIAACVVVPTTGCKRRPQTYAGVAAPEAVGTPQGQPTISIDPNRQNQ